MSPYFGVRRFNPYLGVIQVIDVGDTCAYSSDGRSWRVRQRADSGYFRWGATVISSDSSGEVSIVHGEKLLDAMKRCPPVPFPMRDHYELWLLDHKNGLPLALLKTVYKDEDMDEVTDPHWRPFALMGTEFVSPSLNHYDAENPERYRNPSHRDRLESLINHASRPMPVAQWIVRQADGSGIGANGLRINRQDDGRIFNAAAFPELLISENWERPEDVGLVKDYHNWQAALLLAHHELLSDTRERLEKAASERPDDLLKVYPLIPEILNEEAIEVAMVRAKLTQAAI